MYETSKSKIAGITFLLAFAMPFVTQAGMVCENPIDCYCHMDPWPCGMLVRAEVVKWENERVDLSLMGEPHYDPEGHLGGMQTVENLICRGRDISPGDVGLFRLTLQEYCGHGTDERILTAFLLEVDGRYPCEFDPEHPGLTEAEVVQAALGIDCPTAVKNLGFKEPECDGIIDEGCCHQTIASLDHGILLVVFGLVLLPGRLKQR